MLETITYRFLGIPIWSVTRKVDEDALYERIATRVYNDLQEALRKAGVIR